MPGHNKDSNTIGSDAGTSHEDDWDDITALMDSTDFSAQPLPRVTEKIKSVQVMSAPKVETYVRQVKQQQAGYIWRTLRQDRWLVAIILVACTASIASLIYFYQQGLILTYGDSYSHMLIARRVFDNLTPGLAQLGGVWLPLPHLLMMPFISNNFLWYTGLAGSCVAMPCYVISSIYIYLTANRLTHNRACSFVGTLIFVLNPNVLYLQTTPLSELVLIATMIMACYHFLAWAQDDSSRQLILAALGVLLATMSRYDGWFLFVVLLGCLAVISRMRRHSWGKFEGNFLMFSIMGGLGISLWLLWCWVIFGDPLYWQRGPFSSQTQQMALLKEHILFTYHNLWQSIRYFGLDASSNVGPVFFVIGLGAIALFYLRRRISIDMVVGIALLSPFFFYIISLYGGQAAIYVPDAVPASAPNPWYNARYGVQAVPSIAIFVALLAVRLLQVDWSSYLARIVPKLQQWKGAAYPSLSVLFLVPFILVQAIWIANSGIISLQSGQYGLECSPQHPATTYLFQHYDGGKILEDTFTSPTPMVDFKNVIYEGSNVLWKQTLANPVGKVNWILVNPTNQNDLLTEALDVHSAFFSNNFELVLQERNGLSLYRQRGLPPAPTHVVPSVMLVDHSICGTGGPAKPRLTSTSLEGNHSHDRY
ncbi:hypothetical protein KDA_71900 [Dictyobacter alpinus]|uniref:Glycosyltransferase RgtA/B/C/D-like domain-containing protein n=1 Tax=Dictyobacter alpinus TaxID=2014873 RepID=A0A402BK51_9CHLR|nr:glycosyltransferase family 39 protein [Dictyobacter alpinus]GCE31706.1 hypothetical protein KDA_71900 [Dictyobacter alpinus]